MNRTAPAKPPVPAPTSIRFDPPYPKAGEEFKIIVRLSQPAQTAITVLFEKQRFKFKPAPGETPALRPTGKNYFAIDPTAIDIPAGKQEGESGAKVREDAEDSDDRVPVQFPDNLVLTYYVPDEALGTEAYAIGIVKIQAP